MIWLCRLFQLIYPIATTIRYETFRNFPKPRAQEYTTTSNEGKTLQDFFQKCWIIRLRVSEKY